MHSSGFLRQNSAVFHFLHVLLRDLAVFPFWSELTTSFKLLEIHAVHLTEIIRGDIPACSG